MVIGILIAIQVDNWNEERIAAENTKDLFQKVSEELVLNIKNIDRIMGLHLWKDSLYFIVFNEQLEYDDYRNSRDLSIFVYMYDRTSLVEEDFKELVSEKGNLTKLQDSLFSELRELYGTRKKNTDIDDKTIHDAHLNFRATMKKQSWWFEENTKNIVSDEMIQFLLTDNMYINELSELQYFEYWHTMGLLWFRTKALDLYEEIADMLQIEKDSSLVKNIDLSYLKGVYKSGEHKTDIIGDNEINFRWIRSDSTISSVWDIHPYGNNYLILTRQDHESKGNFLVIKIVFGENSKVLGFIRYGDMREVAGKGRMWKKIK